MKGVKIKAVTNPSKENFFFSERLTLKTANYLTSVLRMWNQMSCFEFIQQNTELNDYTQIKGAFSFEF